MTATNTKQPRITDAMTPAEKRRAVENLLRELAYVLHTTRKVSRDLRSLAARPARPAARPTPAASAV